MPELIHPDDLHEVKRRTDLAAVIEARTPLSPGPGDHLIGRCPLHEDPHRKFNVRPHRGRWHCFGCGAGGDVVKFVMCTEDLSFAQAVQRLAAAAGIELRYVD
ncbi:hypothetical protein GCM10027586_01480 [Kineococcus gypseus]|uniref:CHC2 zinc finger domain-containing protein n=1 Tax=Kineococcus gypseus TaxID=1637102 RepID=UPI003D7D30FC